MTTGGTVIRLAEVSQALLDLIAPPRCAGCEEFSRQPLCSDCITAFELIDGPYCPCCGTPLMPSIPGWPLCQDCREHPDNSFTGARSVALHNGALREAIIQYKYHNRRELAGCFAQLLARRFEDEFARPRRLAFDDVTAIVPVVLHPARCEWRGFDQAHLIAQELARYLERPLWDDVIKRVRNTQPQVDLTPEERAENMQGAFEACRPWKLNDAVVLLVDDVYTTGVTLQVAAQTLREAGAREVFGLTLARAQPQWAELMS